MIRNLSIQVLVDGEWIDVPVTPDLEAEFDALHEAIEKERSEGPAISTAPLPLLDLGEQGKVTERW